MPELSQKTLMFIVGGILLLASFLFILATLSQSGENIIKERIDAIITSLKDIVSPFSG